MTPEATEGPARARKMSKQRTLELIKSLEPDDDERTGISKKVSWILRHGYQKVNIKMDEEGWVKLKDLLETEILEDVTEETLMTVIVDKNAQKLRYRLKESEGTMYIKAYSKTERKATSLTGDGERKSQGLRQEAQPFVPSNPYTPVQPGFPPPQLGGYPWPGFGFSPMIPPQWQPGSYPPPFMMEGSGAAGRFRGRIKSFNSEKGFGFIECAETYAQFNRDVFLHKAQFGDMAVGTEVTFHVETNKQGMPQAKDLAPLGAAGSYGKAGKGKGKGGRGKGGSGKAKGGGRSGRGDAAKGGEESTSKESPEDGSAVPDTAAADASAAPADKASAAADTDATNNATTTEAATKAPEADQAASKPAAEEGSSIPEAAK